MPTTAQHDWPRPPLVHDHQQLFVEPVYRDGKPYTVDDEDDPDDPGDT